MFFHFIFKTLQFFTSFFDVNNKVFASLVEKGILRRTEEGGRSTNYELVEN